MHPCWLPQKGNPQCVAPAATNPCAFTTCLVGNFCQVEVSMTTHASVGCGHVHHTWMQQSCGRLPFMSSYVPLPLLHPLLQNGQAICVTNCATVKCTDGTRCETDPQSGNAACVPDGFAMRRMT